MQEFIEKLIKRLEEKESQWADTYSLSSGFDERANVMSDGFGEAIEIVNQLAEEHKDNVMIDGQYCWQTCGATEHCKECNRLCNGSIDCYENYDFMTEEHNNDFCEWKPHEREIDVYFTECGQAHIFVDGNPEENNHVFCPYCGKKIKVAPYQPGE